MSIFCLPSEERCKKIAETFLGGGGIFWGPGIAYQMLSKLWLMVGNHLCNTLSFYSTQVMFPTMFHNGCSDVPVQLLASILILSNNLRYLAANVWIINPSILTSEGTGPFSVTCLSSNWVGSISHNKINQSLDTTISKGWTGHSVHPCLSLLNHQFFQLS